MIKSFGVAILILLFFGLPLSAQLNTIKVCKDALKINREKTYNNIVKNIITKNLLLPLSDSTEENWEDAFYAIELVNFKAPWIATKIQSAFNCVEQRTNDFNRALLELVYADYSKIFLPQVIHFAQQTHNSKLFAICAEYIFACGQKEKYKNFLLKKMGSLILEDAKILDPFLKTIENKLEQSNIKTPPLKYFFDKKYLPNQTIVFSFQRKNRNYPGIVLVRDSTGHFVKNKNDSIFYVPQLARSINNLPGYLTKGNTPQGIFKITGFDVSKSPAIGSTTNIQLLLPFEKRENISDSLGIMLGENYNSLLPKNWQNYFPIMEAYYAGIAGRSEIIAHGTTVNPQYYWGMPFYPHTPTEGCLCTKEIWSEVDGKLLESNQQKLVDAVKTAGGAKGYLIVIEIDNQQKPVGLNEILALL